MPNWRSDCQGDAARAADAADGDRSEACCCAAIIADRAQGYSLVDREAEPHFRSISVPVRRYDGAIIAAINMGAHVDRVSAREMIERFLPLLRDAAELGQVDAAVRRG